MGYWKTLKAIQNTYYWQNMHQDIYAYVTKCEICRTCKQTQEQTRVSCGAYRDPGQPGRMLSIDMIGPLPSSTQRRHQYAIVCIDVFSKYTFARSYARATAENLCEFFENDVLNHFHTPEVLISDNGKQFISKMFTDLLKKYRIRHHRTPNYHAQANPVEATNKTIKSSLRAKLEACKSSHKEWADLLPQIVRDINTTPHTTTGKSPYYILFGREKVCTGDEYRILLDENPNQTADPDRAELIREEAAENARGRFEVNKKQYNTRARVRKFKVGDMVRCVNKVLSSAAEGFSQKLAPKRREAYVKAAVGKDTYELIDKSGKNLGMYHANDLITA